MPNTEFCPQTRLFSAEILLMVNITCELLLITSNVVFCRTRVYQMQPRNGQNWHSCSHEIGHILPVCLRNNSCRADRINEPHKKNSLIEGEELQHIRYRSRTSDTETKTTFCTSLKLEFISGWVEINSNFREAQNSGFGFRFIRSWALTNARSRLYLIDPSSREHNRAW